MASITNSSNKKHLHFIKMASIATIGLYALMILDSFLTFGNDPRNLLLLGFITFFLTVSFMLMPMLASSWRENMHIPAKEMPEGEMECWTGSIHNWEAMVLVVLVPAALAVVFTILCIFWRFFVAV